MSELKLHQSRLDGRYDIVDCLGRGSYAEIYVANDNAAVDGAPRTVVIKALNLHLQDEPDVELERTLVSNFQNEAVALDRVRHPNVINRLGHGTAIDLAGTTFHYIVLEYLPGGDMFALTRTRPLSMQRALHYLEQVCSGLAHAHKCGVIHRDIKPQNLLLTADKEVVKIADFGVARLDATEGAITRVGTNIYSAPEHNPLMQTGQLDTTGLRTPPRDFLTPAADIYSLAKTTYSLLAGESPRRFAQHAITELPAPVSGSFWARPILRVLERATQSRPEDRYQTVEEFWDDIADASLPPTRPLQMVAPQTEARRKPSADLSVEPEDFTEAAPPRPHFALPEPRGMAPVDTEAIKRPRIVVPINLEAQRQMELREREQSQPAKNAAESKAAGSVLPPSRTRRALVAAGLILAFSGMLLATHKYVTTHWNPLAAIPSVSSEPVVIGREGVTTTDLNLRSVASSNSNVPIGLAESGSKVRVLNVDNNWYEVVVVQHGRPKSDPYSSDRGWVNKRYIKFD